MVLIARVRQFVPALRIFVTGVLLTTVEARQIISAMSPRVSERV